MARIAGRRMGARRLAAVAGALAGLALGALAPGPVQQIDDTERAFARAAAQSGIAPAFRQFAAPDAVMFLPDPVQAQPQLAGARWPGELLWRARYIGVAGSGDLAFSAGPSLLRAGGRATGGFYLSIWRRQPDGSWRFILDHGADMPAAIWAARPQPPVALTVTAAGPLPNEGMREADGDLNIALPRGGPAAFAARLDDQAILVRPGRPVAEGRRRALALAAEAPPILDASTLGGGRSADGGFGYTWGRARWFAGAGSQTGYYVRVWRATPRGWRLLADHLAER